MLNIVVIKNSSYIVNNPPFINSGKTSLAVFIIFEMPFKVPFALAVPIKQD